MKNKLAQTIVVRVSKDEKETIKKEAKSLGTSVSELLRTKATTTFAEQVNEHASAQNKALYEKIKMDLEENKREHERINKELMRSLWELFQRTE